MSNAAQPDELRDLIAISRRYGADPAFVLAGGGNTSYKLGNRLWVKASGHALATIGQDGFVELDRDALEAMLNANWPEDSKEREALFVERVMATRIHPELKQRPSVEALIHHLLPEKFVVHTHPSAVNALTCCIRGEDLTTELFGKEILWQEYVDPGLILAKTIRRSLTNHFERNGHAPAAIFLENHGLIVSANTTAEIEAISERTVSKIRSRLDGSPPSAPTNHLDSSQTILLDIYAAIISRLIPGISVAADSSEPILQLLGREQGRNAALSGPLTPDQIVYCRSFPMWIENPTTDVNEANRQLKESRAAYVKKHGLDPWVCLIAGTGMITFRESPKLAEVTRSIYVDAATVYHNAERLGGAHVLSRRDQQFIEQWEVEAYRRSVMSKSTQVTGS